MEQEKLSKNAENSEKKWENYSDDIKNLEIKQIDSTETIKNLDWIKDTYSEGIDHYIDSLCESEDDNKSRTPDDYTYSIALEKIVPEEKQIEMVNRRIAVESAVDEEVLKGLSDFLLGSDISSDEIISSPFARKDHADYLAGRNEGDENLELIWGFDKDFANSTEAMSLISDQDYLKKVYGEENAEIGEQVKSAVLTGEVPLSELLDDPYLRGKRIQAIEAEKTYDDYPEEILDIWERDKEFSDSLEYDSYKRRKIYNAHQEHPEIFSEVSQEEVDKITGEIMDKISDRDLKKIAKLYKKSPYQADQVLLDKLAPLLGIEENPPEIVYTDDPERHPYGGYNHKHNKIYFFHIPPEKKRGLIEKAKNMLSPELTSDDEIAKRIEVIAHEAWHAHQYSGVNVEDNRKQLYLLNFKKYDPGEYCFGGGDHHDAHARYKEQLIEKEAWTFGKGMVSRVAELQKDN